MSVHLCGADGHAECPPASFSKALQRVSLAAEASVCHRVAGTESLAIDGQTPPHIKSPREKSENPPNQTKLRLTLNLREKMQIHPNAFSCQSTLFVMTIVALCSATELADMFDQF